MEQKTHSDAATLRLVITWVLLFFDQVQNLMANSCPVATVFVDFKTAFDQLWFEGCLGKLRQMGVPKSYIRWIDSWLRNRRVFIEINRKRSRWFSIFRGGPQGSILSPSLFICYHADMGDSLMFCLSSFFADDLAAVVAGRIGVKYTIQCIDLERRLKLFLDNLEYYTILTIQPISWLKTEAIWSARANNGPRFKIRCGDNKRMGDERMTGDIEVPWTKELKYLGYVITPKLGFGNMIRKTMLKVRQRVGMVNAFRISGSTSYPLRKVLFLSYILPLFTWLFPLYPLFTVKQQRDLNHYYYTTLRRVMFGLQWRPELFAFLSNEISLDDRCLRY